MKRSGQGSSHAAVVLLQPCKGLERVRVADNARDLSPARGVRGLALSAGLGLGHGLGRLVAANVRGAAFGNFQRRPAANRSAIEANHEGAIGFGGDGHFASIPVQFVGHFVLRVGPIPTMCESLHVTSDTSTTAGRLVPPGRMTLPAYVLQLLTDAPASALSGQQARAIRLADGLHGFFLID